MAFFDCHFKRSEEPCDYDNQVPKPNIFTIVWIIAMGGQYVLGYSWGSVVPLGCPAAPETTHR